MIEADSGGGRKKEVMRDGVGVEACVGQGQWGIPLLKATQHTQKDFFQDRKES